MRAYFIVFAMLTVIMFGVSEARASSVDELEKQINDAAEKTSTTINKAKQLIRVATTTAGVAVDAYNKTEKAVSSTVEVVKRGSAVYNNLKPIVNKLGDWWNFLTNNNEYWRVAAVVGVGIFIWVIIRFVL